MEDARATAQLLIDQWNDANTERAERLEIELPTFVLNDNTVAEGEFGWVFSYQSKRFLISGNFSDMLAGNAPLLVCRSSGKLFELGTAAPMETYIDNFVRYGDPHSTSK